MFDFMIDPGFQTEKSECGNQIQHQSDLAGQGKTQQMGNGENSCHINDKHDGPDDDAGNGIKLSGNISLRKKFFL